MKILLLTTPGASHLMPMVPFARAAELSGHSVLAVASDGAATAARGAGLVVADPSRGRDLTEPYTRMARTIVEQQLDHADTLAAMFAAFDEINAMLVDDVEQIARDWGADTIVHTPISPAGRTVARSLGIRAILHQFGLRNPQIPWSGDRDGSRTAPDVEIALSPDVLERASSVDPAFGPEVRTVPMYPATYNGGGALPAWALRRGSRPRVLATLGSFPQSFDDGSLYAEVVAATERMGAELVLTTAGAELDGLPRPLPEHVRLVDWIPLGGLLPTCDVIVHHGGAGTGHSAYLAGVPQVVIPMRNGDSLVNAEATHEVGAGVMVPVADGRYTAAAAVAVRTVLGDPGYVERCREIRAAFEALPGPHEAVAAALA